MISVDQQKDSLIDQKPAERKVLIETWGCQMNVADSEQMLALLQKQNYQLTNQVEDADLILLNTCHIREKATHKVLSRLGRIRELTSKKPGVKVAVAGCVAQAEGAKLMEKASNIDILLGPGKIQELPSLLTKHEQSGKPVLATGFQRVSQDSQAVIPDRSAELSKTQSANPTITGKNEISRYVNIAQGCNNFCTFCVVPFTRGREISRSPQEILSEVKSLIDEGAKEVTLLGQNVNSYGQDLVERGVMTNPPDGTFVDLLRQVAQVEGLERLRFTTSNPHDFTKPLADLFQDFPQLGRYIHLPVQSGDDEILERMKRKVTVAEYWERIRWLRSIDPEFAISTDLIVGFPGETEEQFEGTIELVQKVRYSFIYAFKYSPRKSTAAARFRDQIDETEKSRRLAKLNQIQDQITLEWNTSEIGREREVLIHYASRKEANVYYGRTQQFRLTKVSSHRDLVGKTVRVTIKDANKTALVGDLFH